MPWSFRICQSIPPWWREVGAPPVGGRLTGAGSTLAASGGRVRRVPVPRVPRVPRVPCASASANPLVQRRKGRLAKRAREAAAWEDWWVGRARVRRGGVVARGNKSSEPRLNLSGSWQQGHSAAYNTPFLIQVVCKGFIVGGLEIVIADGS